MDLPLAGITVVELGTSLAAPFAGLILRQMGAEVIKIEQPGTGDPARTWGPPIADDTSVIFQMGNRGKKSVVLNLADEKDRQQLHKLIAERADVVLQNLRPGVVKKLSLDADTLCEETPSLVYCNMGAYGNEGPWSMRPGYDPLVQAFSGLSHVTGPEDGGPCRVGVPVSDFGTGMWAVIGIQSCLLRRQQSGRGGIVDVALLDTALGWMSLALSAASITGKSQGRHGLRGPGGIVPNEGYDAADGILIITAGTDPQFTKLCEVLGHPEWATDPRFVNARERHRHADVLGQLIAGIVATQSRAHWMELLDEKNVPNSPIFTPLETLAHPQTQACGMIEKGADGNAPQIGLPLQIDGERALLDRHVPTIGEHTEQYIKN